MSKIRVGVLRGGPSNEYDVSLNTGKMVLNALPRETYDPIDVFIDRDGEWHVGGYPLSPEHAMKYIDVVWNALHGEYGAGEVQRILDALQVPYTGSGSFESAVASHRVHARTRLTEEGIRVPLFTHFDSRVHGDDEVFELFRTFPHPTRVSSAWSSSKNAVVRTFGELQEAIEYLTNEYPVVFIDAHVPGVSFAVVVIENMRGDDLYVPSPIGLSGAEARLSREESEELQEIAKRAHEALSLRHYSLHEFVVSPRGIYLIETKAAPEFYVNAPLIKSLEHVGIPLSHFLDHVISLSRA